ncbi:MAG: response regulator transcription factor [Labilibaculum sp.]|nr:response regulator transcription factor [Labilibaculum sp.]
MLKVVIIEDEEFTAKDLFNTIKKIDNDIEIVTTLFSVEEALEFFKTNDNFDLIFSDIQLPDGLSFDIYKAVKIKVPVIFCTAFDKYALAAFDANGIDYLLKPFNKLSVSKALDKYMALKSNFRMPETKLDRLMQKLEDQISHQSNSVIVYQGDKILPIETNQIAIFYLEDGYVFALTFDSKKYILTQNLEELENLCGNIFFRANRQHLVNRKSIIDASKYFNRKILINLTVNYPEQILVGKLKNASFLQWLANN